MIGVDSEAEMIVAYDVVVDILEHAEQQEDLMTSYHEKYLAVLRYLNSLKECYTVNWEDEDE